MLHAHDHPDSFLEPPNERPTAAIDESIHEGPGAHIGPYKLVEPIGEGGFGVVFRAEQQQPLRRQVALKVLKPGMDTRQVVVRFEAERQALAIMDHPNIARVFDGGATPSGRPYFVMELVKGVPITQGPGSVIGPYKLLEQIGEGGFGVVFMAEQVQPIRRKVALSKVFSLTVT